MNKNTLNIQKKIKYTQKKTKRKFVNIYKKTQKHKDTAIHKKKTICKYTQKKSKSKFLNTHKKKT